MRNSLRIGYLFLLAAFLTSVASGQSPRADISWFAGGHLAPVASAAYSPDGTLLASGGYFGDSIKLWRVADGTMIRTFTNVAGGNQFIFGPITSITFMADGRTIIALGEGLLGVWNVVNGKFLRTISVSGSDLALSHDGTLIAVAANNVIKLVRFSDGVVIRSISWPGNSVQRVAFSLDDSFVAGGDSAGTLRTFRVTDGAPVLSIPAHSNMIQALRYSPDGTRIATGSADQTVKLWDSNNGTPAGTLVGHAGTVIALSFSTNGALLASGSADSTVKIWNMPSGGLVGTLTQPAPVTAIDFNSTASRLAVSCESDVREWDVPSQTLIRSLVRATNQISGTVFTPDNSKLVASSYDGKVSVYDVNTGALLRQMIPGGNAFAVATSADTIAAAINVPNVVKLYRLSDGGLVRTLVPSGSLPYTYSASFSPDGATLATGHFNDTVQLWNVSDGTLLGTLPGQSGAMNGVAYSPNGSFLVAASAGGYVHVWDAAGNPIRTLGPVGQALTCIAVSSDNQFILAGGENGLLQSWRLDNGAFVYAFSENGHVTSVRFAPSGFAFYAAHSTNTFTANGTIQIYRASDHALLETYNLETSGFGSNPSGPLSLAVSPDGKRVGYGRDDATVVMAYNTLIAAPTSATLFMGQLVSGSFHDLVLPDGAALIARPGFNGDRQSAPVQLDIGAHVPLPNPSRLSFQIVAVATSNGLQQEIWMKNAQNGTFELVDARPAATTDQTLRILLGPNILRYIDASGNILARVKWFGSPNGSRSWQISVDQAIWPAGL